LKKYIKSAYIKGVISTS